MTEQAPTKNNLASKHIVLCISSGIAAYKAPMLVRVLRGEGADVQVVMTANAHRFVSTMALQAVSGRPVRQSLWDENAEAAMGHIELARWADVLLVAPATANCIAQLVHGISTDLLSTLCLATEAPVVIAPAMNQRMYRHPATQRNLALATEMGYQLVGPENGEQACGDFGPGRMTEPERLVEQLVQLLQNNRSKSALLAHLNVMITAGPTVEAIDPVRFISNHSSGKQGLALAESAYRAGATVTLVTGPGVPPSPEYMRRLNVRSAQQMHDAVLENLDNVDVFIGVAAVADYRPASVAEQKIKRSGKAKATMTIELVENPDIIAAVATLESGPLVIGFAAETNDTLEHARQKRTRKGLDAIVCNDVSDVSIGFNSDHNAATLIHDQGEITFPRQSKQQLADGLIKNIVHIFAARFASSPAQTVTK